MRLQFFIYGVFEHSIRITLHTRCVSSSLFMVYLNIQFASHCTQDASPVLYLWCIWTFNSHHTAHKMRLQFFIYGVFEHSFRITLHTRCVSSSLFMVHLTTLSEVAHRKKRRDNQWIVNRKGCGRKWSLCSYRHYPETCQVGLTLTKKILSQSSRSPGWDSNRQFQNTSQWPESACLDHLIYFLIYWINISFCSLHFQFRLSHLLNKYLLLEASFSISSTTVQGIQLKSKPRRAAGLTS